MRRFLCIVLLAVAIFAGCAGSPPQPATVDDESCRLRGPDATPEGTLPMTAVRSEQILPLDAQTLVTVDCSGVIQRGCAQSYSGSDRRWVFTVRGAAAPDVARGWMEAIAHGAGVDSVRALDDRRLEVFLERPELSTLASLDFALAAPTPASVYVREGTPLWTMVDGTDDRDILAGADLMVVEDAAIADYASGLGMAVSPLPYARTFVMLVTGAPRTVSPTLAAQAGVDLALAVRTASARPAETPAWWHDDLEGCAELSSLPGWGISSAPGDAGPPCVYYDAGDAVARDLAERIVALAAMDTTRSAPARAVVRSLGGVAPLAVGVVRGEMERRLERGDGMAFVTSVRNPVPDSCGSARSLLRRAPWLRAEDGTITANLIPLIDTRGFVVLGNRAVVVRWDFYGNVRIMLPVGEP